MPVHVEKREDRRDADRDDLPRAEERRFGYEGSQRHLGLAAILLTVIAMVALIYFLARAILA